MATLRGIGYAKEVIYSMLERACSSIEYITSLGYAGQSSVPSNLDVLDPPQQQVVGAVVTARRLAVRRRRPEVLQPVPAAHHQRPAAAAAAGRRRRRRDGRKRRRRDGPVAGVSAGRRGCQRRPGEGGVPPRGAAAARSRDVGGGRRLRGQRSAEVDGREEANVTRVTVEQTYKYK